MNLHCLHFESGVSELKYFCYRNDTSLKKTSLGSFEANHCTVEGNSCLTMNSDLQDKDFKSRTLQA